MSKSVLVIYTPEDCESCVLHSGIFRYFCKICCRYIEDLSVKPDWCPLKPMPEKKIFWSEEHGGKFSEGWNACIDAITGEENGKTDTNED